MRALTVISPGTWELQDREDREPSPQSLRIAPRVVGICGTDLDIIDGTIDPAFVRYPIVIGHEWAGTVVVGNAEIPSGSRVVVEGIIACGICAECLTGDTNRCVLYDEYGFTRDGAAADYVDATADLVHVLADHVSWDSAVLTEPAAVVLRALQRAAPASGGEALVIGDGTVALLAAVLLRQWSPSRVVMLGARDDQRALALKAGVDVFTTDPDSVGNNFSIVVEAAGAIAATATAFAACARGGRIVLIGYPGHGKTFPLPVDDVINNDLNILGSFSYTRSAWADVVALLNSGAADFSFLVTHHYPLADCEQALGTLRNPSGARGKVVLEMTS